MAPSGAFLGEAMENLCLRCFERKPVEEFEIEEVIEASGQFSLGVGAHTVNVRSFTCKACGTTKRADWIREWRQI